MLPARFRLACREGVRVRAHTVRYDGIGALTEFGHHTLLHLTCFYTPAACSVGALADLLSLSHLGGGVWRVAYRGRPSIISIL